MMNVKHIVFSSLLITVLAAPAYAQDTSSQSTPSTPAVSGNKAVNQNDEDTSNTNNVNKVSLKDNTDKVSYAIGADIGRNFKNLNVPLNPQLLAQGVKDALEGSATLMDPKDIQSTLVGFQKELISKRQENMQKVSVKNKEEGEKFLAENKTKPGVVTLPDGLQYKIVKQGKGESPKNSDTVVVNYEGTLLNGQVFDSSYAKGKPVSFPVDRVIPGWTEALKLMKPGSQWMVFIPAALAYGDHGMGPIEANQTLIFKIELIAVQPSSQPAPAAPAPTAVTTSEPAKK